MGYVENNALFYLFCHQKHYIHGKSIEKFTATHRENSVGTDDFY